MGFDVGCHSLDVRTLHVGDVELIDIERDGHLEHTLLRDVGLVGILGVAQILAGLVDAVVDGIHIVEVTQTGVLEPAVAIVVLEVVLQTEQCLCIAVVLIVVAHAVIAIVGGTDVHVEVEVETLAELITQDETCTHGQIGVVASLCLAASIGAFGQAAPAIELVIFEVEGRVETDTHKAEHIEAAALLEGQERVGEVGHCVEVAIEHLVAIVAIAVDLRIGGNDFLVGLADLMAV